MLNKILPIEIIQAISKINLKNLCEIRLRVDAPIIVNLSGINEYLSTNGVTKIKEDAIFANNSLISYIINKSCNNSIYTINDQLIKGYISIGGGIRIGVAGEIVNINNSIKTIKNITSLNIRIPHEVKNCALNTFNYLVRGNRALNTLIVSPAGAGKTTYLKDLIYQISNKLNKLNILVVDERNEIAGANDGKFAISNNNIDVFSNCTKSFAFESGIRSMKPDIIITDELNLDSDITAIENAITSGVNIIATIHANNICDLKNKRNFKYLLERKLFSRFVFLSNNYGPGTIEGIYNEDFSCIYC